MAPHDSLPTAARLLGRLWLHEVAPGDVATIAAVPDLAETLPRSDAAALDDLAAEYHRLVLAGIPPYESVFVDPSAMLTAPATSRVDALYRTAGWSPPADARVGAADHLGVELLALADAWEGGHADWARRLQVDHLALWAPVFAQALRTAEPHAFYERLADLTLDLVLDTLPCDGWPRGVDPLPALPPPPVYRGSDAGTGEAGVDRSRHEAQDPDRDRGDALSAVVRRLVTPREAGLYLTREAIASMARGLELPQLIGERRRMLTALFQAAGQYEQVPELFEALVSAVDEAAGTYVALSKAFPQWTAGAAAWQSRLVRTRTALREWRAEAEVA